MLIYFRYWQCQLGAQRYAHAHGTRNPCYHLTSAHGIREETISHNKRLKQYQQTMESMIKSASEIAQQQHIEWQEHAVEKWGQEEAKFPPLSSVSMENFIVLLLIRSDLPFPFATSQELHDLLYSIRLEAAQLLPSSPNTIMSWIFRCYKHQKSILKNLLPKSLPQIHSTIDHWT